MHGADLTADVQTGLAWYYLLVTLLNLGAAAWWTFWGRGQSMLRWERAFTAVFGSLYALLAVGWLFGLPVTQLYIVGTVANAVGVVTVLPAAVYHRVYAGAAWCLFAVGFQLIGIPYCFHSGPVMPPALRDAVDRASTPVTFFFGSVILLAAFIYFRTARVIRLPGGFRLRIPIGLTDTTVGWLILNLVCLYFGFSMTDHDFRLIVAKPDNVPIAMMLLAIGFFTWLAMRQAVINDRRLAQGLRPREADDAGKVLTWPDLVYIELIATVITSIVLVVWSVLLQAPLEEWANPNKTPNPSKAPWYFLGLQEMLVYFDPWLAGVVFPGLIIFGLMAIPYIDFNKEGVGYYTFRLRRFGIVVFMFGFIVLWVLMVILGTFMRGPGWNFFGPYQTWDPHLVVPQNNVDLSDFFWVHWLRRAKPEFWVVRELPGIILLALYFFAVPLVLAKTVLRGFFLRMGIARYAVFVFLLLSMALLPMKMLLRWMFNLKYILHLHEFFFNI